MGLFCVSLHFRTPDSNSLSAALDRRQIQHYRVLPAVNGWTSLYEQRASDQDDSRIRELMQGLTHDLSVVAIAFLVHDSDIACYWLYDRGRQLDEYNSCPNYFEDLTDSIGGSGPAGGDAQALLPFCQSGTTAEDLESILTQEVVFAEEIIEKLSSALGISLERAMANYADVTSTGRDSANEKAEAFVNQHLAQIAGSMELSTDPRAGLLVGAAGRGDLKEVDQLLKDGVGIDAIALPAHSKSSKGKVGAVPTLPLTPLMMAVLNKQGDVVKRLLKQGADANRVDPLMGTPVHTAVRMGEPEVLQLLIDAGADVNGPNSQGQTPLQILEHSKTLQEGLAKAQAMFQKLAPKSAKTNAAFSRLSFPVEAWAECERLLRENGAK